VYAIIEDSGRQFKVSEGDAIEVDLRELAEGRDTLEFDRVLMIGDGKDSVVGQPLVEGAKVTARLEGMVKGEKLVVQHFKRRKDSRSRVGHRQKYLRVVIEKISS
jgi:large subunit ribosomal protein L21